jgi:hypothetical protein
MIGDATRQRPARTPARQPARPGERLIVLLAGMYSLRA